MARSSNRRLSIVEATRLLYRTDAPSDQQIGRVYERMKAGLIRVHDRAATPRDWTTTEQDLADYVAAEMMKRQSHAPSISVATTAKPPATKRTAEKPSMTARPQVRDAQHLKQVYHNIWRDAFLAVLLRRRIAHRSATFHRCALAGQVLLLVTLVGTAAALTGFTMERTPPEHTAIERWIDENTDFFEVVKWYPVQTSPDGAGSMVEVEYRYTKDSRRVITTRRTLLVQGEDVREMADE
ncbi:MAG: hypothetical protein KF708_16245 [Pirellulales bacterium]|nr:hypothetical protein [Pirellulales bacterium]